MGTAAAGRRHADLEPLIGMFVNTLALRNQPCAEKTITVFVQEVKEKTLRAFENQDYPFEELVEKVPVERDTGRNPIFDVMFTLQNMLEQPVRFPSSGDRESPDDWGLNPVSKFDLTILAYEGIDELAIRFEYAAALFKQETVQRFIGYFKKVITGMVENPGAPIGDIEIIANVEKQQILFDFNQTHRDYPRDKTIHELFAEEVERRPDSVGIVGSMQLTYGELNQKSDQVARALKEKGLLVGSISGIMVERSVEMVIGILGILKSGAAYMPIDPDYPGERIRFMLKDSDTGMLLTTRLLSEKIAIEKGMVYLDEIGGNEAGVSYRDTAANFAYIMYTSGSTGWPKGVLVTHRNVVRLVRNTNFIELTEKTRILQTGAPVFDATTFEIWGSLLNGGQLVLTGKEVILDARQLGKALRCFDVNTLWLSAPLFNQLLENDTHIFSCLDSLLVGGDALSPIHINRVGKAFPGLVVINGYGPTENTTFSTTYRIREEFEHNIPIGSPIANSTAYIVDINGHFQPIGVCGELVVGGDGVACGYINNPELTAEKFLDLAAKKREETRRNKKLLRGVQGGSFLEKSPPGRRRLYKTGDLARWLVDGNIEFLGRIDHQVKIRGFRVELTEIENQLLQIPGIKEAVVTTVEERKSLCAYIVFSSPGEELDPGVIKGELSTRLPDYMIPAYFVSMERIPLNPNGKVDRKSLPEPGAAASTAAFIPPRREREEKLAAVFSGVLNIEKEKIGIDDDFFELGGHSLKATMLAARIHREMEVHVPLTQVFINPTIRGLSRYIGGLDEERYTAVDAVELKEYYPLSSAQKRLYVLQQMEPGNTNYNMPFAVPLGEGADKEKLEGAFRELVARHEMLRTSFQMVGEMPVQRSGFISGWILPWKNITLGILTLTLTWRGGK
jgi:tyrocidine synthetase-3